MPKIEELKKVAVAVLNWNGKDLLKEFLPSVVKHSSNADLFVIDNNSTDESISFLEENYSGIQIIQTGKNDGYAGGYNYGLEHIQNEYIILLNSDVEVTENWIEPQLQLFEENKWIGACQPKILAYKQKNTFEYAGAGGGYIDLFGYPFCRGRLFEVLEKDKGQYNDTKEIFWASGACMMVRRKAFYDAGKLDQLFFAHMEEIDLCWRMKNIGYQVMYCGSSTIYHLGGATLDSQSPKKTYLNFRNNLYLLFKNLPSNVFFPVLFIRLILDGVAGVKFLFDLKWKHTIAIVKAHFSFYYHFWELSKERHTRLKSKKLKGFNTVGIYNRISVLDHYLFKKNTFKDLPGKIS